MNNDEDTKLLNFINKLIKNKEIIFDDYYIEEFIVLSHTSYKIKFENEKKFTLTSFVVG
jgi:O-methyltransferase involved in polyketide biosynthesis